MGTAVLVSVLVVAGIGVPMLALAVDRRFSRSASRGRPSPWKPPAVDVELEKYRLASRHGLTFEQMQAVERTVSRGRPVDPAHRPVAVELARLLLQEEVTEGPGLRRLRTVLVGLAVFGVVFAAWSLVTTDQGHVPIVALGPLLQAVGLEVQLRLRRRRYAGARRTLEAHAPEARP